MSEGTQGKAKQNRHAESKETKVDKISSSETASLSSWSSTGDIGQQGALRTLIGSPASTDTADNTKARRFFDVRSYIQNLVRFT